MIGQRLHACLRVAAGYEHIQVGRFLATFTPSSKHPNRNYAVPDDGIDPAPEQIEALAVLFESRGLRPRLEYVSSAAPALALALLAAGFTIEATIPLLARQPGRSRPAVSGGIAVFDAADERDHEDAMRVAALVYGEPAESIPAEALAARMAMVACGGAVAVARDTTTGEVIGSGLYPVPVEGMTEVAAVGTLPDHRNRGAATALMSHLADRALRRGVSLVWLTAEHDAEYHAALEAGFRDTGETMVHVSRLA